MSEMEEQAEPETTEVQQVEGFTLLEGEDVLHNVRPAWSNWANELILYGLLCFVGIGFLLLPLTWYKRSKTRYIVTSERVMYKEGGLLGSSTNEYRISDIRQLQTGATLVEKVLGHGNIQFSSGGAGTLIQFNGIADYESVANTIRTRQRELE